MPIKLQRTRRGTLFMAFSVYVPSPHWTHLELSRRKPQALEPREIFVHKPVSVAWLLRAISFWIASAVFFLRRPRVHHRSCAADLPVDG
jgi:hypothetical protein